MLIFRAHSTFFHRNIIIFAFRAVQALSSFFVPVSRKVACHTFFSIKERSLCWTIFCFQNRNRLNSRWLDTYWGCSCCLDRYWFNWCRFNNCRFDKIWYFMWFQIFFLDFMTRIGVEIKLETWSTFKALLFIDVIMFIIWAWLASLFIVIPEFRKVTNNTLFSIEEWSWWRTIWCSSDNLHTLICFYIQLESFSTPNTVSFIWIIIGVLWTSFTSLVIFIPVWRKRAGNTFLSVVVRSLYWTFRLTSTFIN